MKQSHWTKPKHAIAVASALLAIVTAPAAAAEIELTPYVMAVISDDAHGRRVTSSKYEQAIQRITHGGKGTRASFADQNNLCVAYTKTIELDKAAAACDAALKEVRKREKRAMRSTSPNGAELYAFNVAARRKARTAAARGTFDRLFGDAMEVIGRHLTGSLDIEAYSRSLILKQLFLGCCDALTETVDDLKRILDERQGSTTKEEIEVFRDRLRAIQGAHGVLQSRSEKNDDLRGLALMTAALDEHISGLTGKLESLGRNESAGRVDAQQLSGSLLRIETALDVYRRWSLYPQFRPSMVERSQEPGNIEGLAVNRDALCKVPRHDFFVAQVCTETS